MRRRAISTAAAASVVSPCGTHHLTTAGGQPQYAARFAAVLAFHTPPGLAPAQLLGDGGHWLHVRPDGNAVYEARFARTFGFYEGLAAVKSLDGGWMHVRPDGSRAYWHASWAWAGNFQGGRCAVRGSDSNYRHIDAGGTVRTGGPHAYAGDFREGSAVVRSLEDGLCRHVDEEGRFRLPYRAGLFDLDVFHKSYARARDARGWFFMSRDGSDACRGARYAAVEPFYNGQALVQDLHGGARRVIAEDGGTLVELPTPAGEDGAALQALSTGYWASFALRAGLQAGTADLIAEGGVAPLPPLRLGPAGSSHRAAPHVAVAEAWRELGLVRPTARREDACSDSGSFTGHYRLTKRGAQLLSGSAARERAVYWLQDRYLRAWLPGLHLPRAPGDPRVADPSPAATMDRSSPPSDSFAELGLDPHALAMSRRVLAGHAEEDWADIGAVVAPLLETAGCGVMTVPQGSVVDVGGGSGSLLRQLARALPGRTQFICFDRPEVVALNNGSESTVPGAAAVTFVAGDMFEAGSIPRAAAVYVLSRVLHDWDDAKALALLVRVREAAEGNASQRGRPLLLVVDRVATAANTHALLSLHMHMLQGARERRADEWAALFAAAGWTPRPAPPAPLEAAAWHRDHAIFVLHADESSGPPPPQQPCTYAAPSTGPPTVVT